MNNQAATCDFTVNKKALWLYQVDLSEDCDAKYLSLTQAYDSGWLAHQGRQRLEHFKLNNWANAWLLNGQNTNTSIYIFYWPQLFEYLGFISITALFIIIFIKWRKSQLYRLKEKRSQ